MRRYHVYHMQTNTRYAMELLDCAVQLSERHRIEGSDFWGRAKKRCHGLANKNYLVDTCSVLQWVVAVCCGVLQYVVVCCSSQKNSLPFDKTAL